MFLIFAMSSACIENRGSSSGRRLYVPVWYNYTSKGKGKAVPLLAWTGPGAWRKLKAHRFRDNGTGLW